MSASDRVRWDDIYQTRNRSYPPPDPLLLTYTPPILDGRVGRALDIAGGVGQNGLWLAEQGYTVDVVDISRVALARARQEMTVRNIRNVNLFQADLDDYDVEEDAYDVVCVFRYLKRDFFQKLKSAVKPGGRIIYETFNIHYLDLVPEFNQNFLLWPGELGEMFAGWEFLYYDHETHNSQMVAVKPAPED
jgi:SAM-dependent methyltransferase